MKFRTTSAMYLPDDRYVERGVEVGDDTPFPLPEGFRPSRTMEALDEDAESALENLEAETSNQEEEGIAARLERENRQLRQENAQLKDQLGQNGPSGMEPWAPITDTGPSDHQANIGKNADGTDIITSLTSGPGQVNNLTDPESPPRVDTPPGASSTTPPQDSIQLPSTAESGRPVPRKRSSILDAARKAPPAKPMTESVPPPEERNGPQTGMDDPSPMAQAQQTSLPPIEVKQTSDEGGQTAKESGGETSRPGDQATDEPNNDLIVKDTETFMPNNEPNAPNAPGPTGAKKK